MDLPNFFKNPTWWSLSLFIKKKKFIWWSFSDFTMVIIFWCWSFSVLPSECGGRAWLLCSSCSTTKKGCPLRGTAPTGLLQRGSCQFRSRRAAVSFAFQQTFIPHVPEQELLLITNCILRNNSIHKQVNSIGPTKQIAITPTREQNCLTWISVLLKRKILKEKKS